MLTDQIKTLIDGKHLPQDVMRRTMGEIMDGKVHEIQIAGFLIALRCKGETVDEITGAAEAMRSRMSAIHIKADTPIFDTCGTGGDGAHTFNISTAVSFVVAAAGITVAKHGNRAISSKSGSADVLVASGVNIAAPLDVVQRCIREAGIGFLFAPEFHPAMRHAATVRQTLGVRTLFNLLGPLTNPAHATHQLMGVFSKHFLVPLAGALGRLGTLRAWVVHSDDGLDEISVCADTHVAEWTGTGVREFTIRPEDVGIARANIDDLAGGDAKRNAEIMREILRGKNKGAMRDAVAINAGAAICIAGKARDLKQGTERAHEILSSGEALGRLDALIAITTE